MKKNKKNCKIIKINNNLLNHININNKLCLNCNSANNIDAIELLCGNFICSLCFKQFASKKTKRIDCTSCKIKHNLGKYKQLVDKQLANDCALPYEFDFHDDLFAESDIVVELDVSDLIANNECWFNKLVNIHESYDLNCNLSISTLIFVLYLTKLRILILFLILI